MNISEIIKQFELTFVAEDILYFAGVAILSFWLLKTAFGTRALADSSQRRNNMPFYLPLVPLGIWLLGAPVTMEIQKIALPDLELWQQAFTDNVIISIAAIIATILTLWLVRRYFARRLKGFGLNPKTIPADFFAAFVNLIAIYPVIMLAVVMTLYIGQTIWGDKFQLPQHAELKSMMEYSQISVRIAIIITAVVVAPVFEELLFRGLFQTLIRSYLNRPWQAIFISAILFASAHANTTHWPALYFLGICIGYSYEKSGSLFRPIFVHAIFNSTSILAALYRS